MHEQKNKKKNLEAQLKSLASFGIPVVIALDKSQATSTSRVALQLWWRHLCHLATRGTWNLPPKNTCGDLSL